MNNITISGRLPRWNGTYTPASKDSNGKDISSIMKWQINVYLTSKSQGSNGNSYNDEALLGFTAWGKFADKLNELNQLAVDAPERTSVLIVLSGRLDVAYVKDGVTVYGFSKQDGSIGSTVSINAKEVYIAQMNNSSNKNNTTPAKNNTPGKSNVVGAGNRKLPMGAPPNINKSKKSPF